MERGSEMDVYKGTRHTIKPPFDFLVKPKGDELYNNKANFGGFEFIVNTSEENHKFSNRYAVVVTPPAHYDGPIKAGDLLLVHHNVFKTQFDMKGRRKGSRSFFRPGEYILEDEQFFMYKNESGWHAYQNSNFVKPVLNDGSIELNTDKYQPLTGEMVYPSEYMVQNSVVKGDIVYFKPDSEYEFEVDGEKMYRIYDSMIVAKR